MFVKMVLHKSVVTVTRFIFVVLANPSWCASQWWSLELLLLIPWNGHNKRSNAQCVPVSRYQGKNDAQFIVIHLQK